MTVSAEMETGAPVPEDDGAPLPWATWLRIATMRLKRDPDERAEVLVAEEIDSKHWSLADRYWNLVMAEKISEGDHSLSDRYAAACVRELTARKQAASAQPPATSAPAAPKPDVAPAPPKPDVAMTPSAPAAEPPTPAFVEPPKPAPVAPPPVKTPLDLGTSMGVIPGVPALPFAPSASAGEAIERAKQHAFEAQPAPKSATAPAAHAPIGETEAVDVGALARRVLAFGPPKSGGPSMPQPAAAAQPPMQAGPAIPMLTVEQYASLVVDLELAPRAPAEVLRRYGVTPEGKRALDEGWSRVFAEQPARRAAFEHAKATYRAWLAKGSR